MLSLIIPSFNRPRSLEKALSSVVANSSQTHEIIVLSPQQDREYRDICLAHSARLVDDESRSNGMRVKSLWQVLNFGFEIASGPYVCWLNDDCTVLPGWDVAALAPFKNADCGIVSLRTQHLDVTKNFILIRTLYGIICANYGVLLKSSGIKFDERFSWFHGDADIALQAEFVYHRRVYGTEEPCVIHEHQIDRTRATNESDPRTKADWTYLNKKWKGYTRIGSLKIEGVPARIINAARSTAAFLSRASEKLSAILQHR